MRDLTSAIYTPIYKEAIDTGVLLREAFMTVSSLHRKPEASFNSGEIFIGFVWLAVYAAIVLTGLWQNKAELVAAVNLLEL